MKIYRTYNDADLLPMLNNGDAAAFEEIYERYWKKLLYVAGKKLHDAALAEELVQDIFVDLWRRRGKLDIKAELGNYLSVAMKYKVLKEQAKIHCCSFIPKTRN